MSRSGFIANVFVDTGDGDDDRCAEHWRERGYDVRIAKRTLTVLGLRVAVRVVCVFDVHKDPASDCHPGAQGATT